MFKIIFENFHLEKLLWIIKSGFKYIVLTGLIFAVLGGGYAFMFGEDKYEASTTLYAYSNPDYINDSSVNISGTEMETAHGLITSYIEVIDSSSFLKEVITSLKEQGVSGYKLAELKKNITAVPIENTAMFVVKVQDENPKNAQIIANTIGKLAPKGVVKVVKSGGISVMDEAVLPTSPASGASTVMYAALGFIVGVLLSLIILIWKGLNDTRIRRQYEIEDLFTIPIIATVPKIEENGKEKIFTAIVDENSDFSMKEAYSDLRTNLLFMENKENCPIIAVTSADKGEGKTTNSINMSRYYSKIDKKTLLIDADMRDGDAIRMLGIDAKVRIGLSEYLSGKDSKPEIITVQDNFYLIPSGNIPPNPSELLLSSRFEELLNELRSQYDVIIIDLPPVGKVSDALSISPFVTTYLIVTREFVTRFEREEKIVSMLESRNASISGFIYNAIDPESPDYNYKKSSENYGYHYDKDGNVQMEKTDKKGKKKRNKK